ncbi:MAG: tetratricopeptide repeat protein [Acidobacteriota bacterium]
MRLHAGVWGLFVSLTALTACQSSRSSDAGVTRSGLTFNKDIAPILFEHCGSCHRLGEPVNASGAPRSDSKLDGTSDQWCIAGAPFNLIEYRDAQAHARQIAAATRKRTMPPFLPEPGYGAFANERRLRPEQIDMIERWVDAGAPEGDPADKPPTPHWPKGWQLGEPDVIVTMPQPYTLPAVGPDVFRNFVMPLPLPSTRYVRAMEFRTDNPRVLHHASVGVDRTRTSRTLDRADREPGFAVMPEDEVRNVYGWSPGKAPFMGPAGSAWSLEAGSDLVAQLHMLPSGKPERIQPSIGLFFTDTPPTHVPLVITLQSKTIDIPAGEQHYTVEDTYLLPSDIDVLSVYPHAHYLATDMKGTATLPDGTITWLFWIKAWDFNWQDTYRYASPLFLPKGTTLTMRFTYDNSNGNPRNPNHPPRQIQWGPQSSDEMGALWLEVLPRHAEDLGLFMRDNAARAMRTDIGHAELQVRNQPEDALSRNFLAAKYLQAGRVPDAVAQLDQALRLKPDDAEAHSNRGIAFQLQNRIPDATRELETASRLKPADDRVHVNLGNVLQAGGQRDAALREYRRAIDINPENADAHFNLALVLGPQGRLDEAIAHLRRALAINPQNASAHRNLGIALGMQGRREQAIDEIREALRIQPGSAEAQQNLDALLKPKRVQPPP